MKKAKRIQPCQIICRQFLEKINWARNLYCRIEEPMEIFRAKSNHVLQVIKKIKELYNAYNNSNNNKLFKWIYFEFARKCILYYNLLKCRGIVCNIVFTNWWYINMFILIILSRELAYPSKVNFHYLFGQLIAVLVYVLLSLIIRLFAHLFHAFFHSFIVSLTARWKKQRVW